MNVANSIGLKSFLVNLADIFDGDIEIEKTARRELLEVSQANFIQPMRPSRSNSFRNAAIRYTASVMISLKCHLIGALRNVQSPLYAKHSVFKSHVELVGPNGLAKSESLDLFVWNACTLWYRSEHTQLRNIYYVAGSVFGNAAIFHMFKGQMAILSLIFYATRFED